MSREIVEAVRELERDRNLEGGILVDALRDGLLAAYKKTPGSYRHATVEIDDAGDFRVFAIHMPADLEERLLEEASERTYDELEKIEEETGEKQHTLVTDDDLEIDWDQVPENQVRREDVTPENFGRIAAQTAKQVIQQRIREAERQIMYEEYVDRVSEVVTGIVQQAGDRNNILVDLGKVEALLPALRAGGRRALRAGLAHQGRDHGGSLGHEGPAGDPLAPGSRADQDALRARSAGDRGRPRGDPRRRARAGLPLEDRRRLARAGRRPCRCVRGPPRFPRPHGRVGAPRREDRHHPVEHRACALPREGTLACAGARGLHRRRDQGVRRSSSPRTSWRSRSARRA